MSRRWFNYAETTLGISILYRVDLPSTTQLWLYSGGRKVLLDTYPVATHPFTTNTLLTHLGGSNIAGGDEDILVGSYDEDNGNQIFPYRSQAIASVGTGSGVSDSQYDLSPNSASATNTFDPSGNGGAVTSSLTNNLIQGTASSTISKATSFGAGIADAEVSYYMPPGTANLQVSLTAANTQTGASTSSTVRTRSNSFGDIIENGATDSLGLVVQGGFGAANSETENQYSQTAEISYGLDRNIMPALRFGVRAEFSAFSGSSSPVSLTASGSVSPSATGLRPTAYLSKTLDGRMFVGLHYIDNGVKIDYFRINPGLSFTKSTYAPDAAMALDVNDLQRGYITYNYGSDWPFDEEFWWGKPNHAIVPGSSAKANTLHPAWNVLTDGRVISFTSVSNSGTNPGLTGLISTAIPEASRILWVAPLPDEAAELDSGGFQVQQLAFK